MIIKKFIEIKIYNYLSKLFYLLLNLNFYKMKQKSKTDYQLKGKYSQKIDEIYNKIVSNQMNTVNEQK